MPFFGKSGENAKTANDNNRLLSVEVLSLKQNLTALYSYLAIVDDRLKKLEEPHMTYGDRVMGGSKKSKKYHKKSKKYKKSKKHHKRKSRNKRR